MTATQTPHHSCTPRLIWPIATLRSPFLFCSLPYWCVLATPAPTNSITSSSASSITTATAISSTACNAANCHGPLHAAFH